MAAVDALRERLGEAAFVLVDHWPDDPEAIGVASPTKPGLLAYISVSSGADEPYFVSLESPESEGDEDQSYMPGDDRNVCEFEELVDTVARHLK